MFLVIKDKNSCFFFLDEPRRVFLFFTFFSVTLFLFMDVFILHLSRVFSFFIFSFVFINQLSRVFSFFTFLMFHFSPFQGVFVLLYHECYWFEKAFFTLRHFLPYIPFPHLPQYCQCYWFERAFFILRRFLPYTPSRHLAQPAFIKASLGASSSSLKVAGPPTLKHRSDPCVCFESRSVCIVCIPLK